MKRVLVLLLALTACSSGPPELKTGLDYCRLLTREDLGVPGWSGRPQADGPDACYWEVASPLTTARVEVDRDTTAEDLLKGRKGEVTTVELRDRPVRLACAPQTHGGNCATFTQVGERTVLAVHFSSIKDDYRDVTTKATEKVLDQVFVTS